MRIGESVDVAASPDTVWHYLEDPEHYLRFMDGIARWEVAGDRANGLGARYRVLIRVGAAEVGGLIEMVEWSEPFDIAWHSVTGVDHRGRWRIRARRDGRTRIELRFAYGVVGGGIAGMLAQLAAAPALRLQLRRSLRELRCLVEADQHRLDAERARAAHGAAST